MNISIIMPLYNAEKYLEEALQSVLNQTYKDFELICINDASTDNTLDILNDFAAKDNRIKIIQNSERKGAAYSRNRGIKESTGNYIIFLDGDDIFDEELLKLAYQEIRDTDADIVMYEYQHVPSEQIYEKKRFVMRSEKFIKEFCVRTFTPRQYEPMEFWTFVVATWNKMYKKSFICSNGLEFQSLPSANDVYFGYMAIMLADKMKFLNDRRVMVYARDHSEVSRISNDRKPICEYLAMEKLGIELVKRGMFEQLFRHYYFISYYIIIGALKNTKEKETEEEFYRFLQCEGIKKITSLCETRNLQCDDYIFEGLKKFEKFSAKDKWYRKETVMSYVLTLKGEIIVSLIKNYKSQDFKIALWGAGITGHALLDFLNNNDIKIDIVVDKDIKKQNNMIDGYLVNPTQKIARNAEIVLTTSYAICNEVVDELKEYNVKVINVRELLGMYR